MYDNATAKAVRSTLRSGSVYNTVNVAVVGDVGETALILTNAATEEG